MSRVLCNVLYGYDSNEYIYGLYLHFLSFFCFCVRPFLCVLYVCPMCVLCVFRTLSYSKKDRNMNTKSGKTMIDDHYGIGIWRQRIHAQFHTHSFNFLFILPLTPSLCANTSAPPPFDDIVVVVIIIIVVRWTSSVS